MHIARARKAGGEVVAQIEQGNFVLRQRLA